MVVRLGTPSGGKALPLPRIIELILEEAMVIAKVIGTIVSTIKHPAYDGKKLLLVQPMHLAGQRADDAFVAIDESQAGVGDTVLVMREGGSARQITQIKDAPIISVIVGILDSVEIESIT